MRTGSALRAVAWLSFAAKAISAQNCTANSTEIGDPCTASAYNAESGCVPEGAEGVCVPLVGDEFTCVTSETAASDDTACGLAGCACFASMCIDTDGSGFCTDDFCEEDNDCTGDQICCPARKVCEEPAEPGGSACGDPHMTGFRGQKFDFVGEDGDWYCVVHDGPGLHLNMRVTSPVPSVPEITYITGIALITADTDDVEHTIVIEVTNPHSLESSCPEGVSPCLADGALSVDVDGHEVLLAPSTVSVGPGVAISAVNLPGGCRTFGFEKYWENKQLEYAQVGRKLGIAGSIQDMGEWILSDPTITNQAECAEYVAYSTAGGGKGLFDHESEHASFQIVTPSGVIRLSHGRLHQLPMRDPADEYDLPEHLTWQMNLAIDQASVSPEATGILGETLVPTVDGSGNPIMRGMEAIRGKQTDYRVGGALDTFFAQDKQHE